MEIGDIWYRYTHRTVWGGEEVLVENQYRVAKITHCGVWVEQAVKENEIMYSLEDRPHFILIKARKKFAHPNKMDALESLIHRKHSQILKLTTTANKATRAMDDARRMIEKLKEDSLQIN